MYTTDLVQLFNPYSIQEFLSNIWGQEFRHFPSSGDRFSHLLTWSALNDTLNSHRLDFPRIRLAKKGENISPFLFTSRERTRHGHTITRLNSTILTRLLRDGATLIIDSIDEMHEPIRALAVSLERVLREKVSANAYVSWGESQGYTTHWDDHDVLIFQISGRKRWYIYGETRRHPVLNDTVPNEQTPEDPLWEEVIMPGDLLNIPRGIWHAARPVGEPSVHLTFSISKRSGLDLLAWLTERLKATEVFRKDIPRFSTSAEKQGHVARMKDALFDMWTPEIMDTFLADCDRASSSRPHFSLPCGVASDTHPLSMEHKISLNLPREPMVERGKQGHTLVVRGNDRQWELPVSYESLIAVLRDGCQYTIGNVTDRLSGHMDTETVSRALQHLLTEDLIMVIG